MPIELPSNISRAREFHRQLLAKGFDHGCAEVSLTALGASFLSEDITELQARTLDTLVQNAGFRINWTVTTTNPLEAEDFDLLILGKINPQQAFPNDEIVGFIWTEDYPDGSGHMMAILPFLDESGKYWCVDSALVMSSPAPTSLPTQAASSDVASL